MKKELVGRTAIVTGGSRGIGKAIATALVQNGAHVVICGRNQEALQKATEDICWPLRRGYCEYRVVDVTKPDQIEKIFSSRFKLDVLVNNVGGAEEFGNFFDLTDRDWADAFNLNLMSMVRFCRGAIPLLKESISPRIINISSLAARQPGRFNPHYGAAKAGMLYLNKYLANELAGYKILVNAVCPGTLKGGGWEKNVADRASRKDLTIGEAEKKMEGEESAKVPLLRMGTLKDVAELVAFLVSDKANFITGQVFDIDGGVRRSVY